MSVDKHEKKTHLWNSFCATLKVFESHELKLKNWKPTSNMNVVSYKILTQKHCYNYGENRKHILLKHIYSSNLSQKIGRLRCSLETVFLPFTLYPIRKKLQVLRRAMDAGHYGCGTPWTELWPPKRSDLPLYILVYLLILKSHKFVLSVVLNVGGKPISFLSSEFRFHLISEWEEIYLLCVTYNTREKKKEEDDFLY